MVEDDRINPQEKDTDFYRLWITPGLVVVGIVAVIVIFRMALTIMPQGVDAASIKDIVSMTGAAIAMVGTLISFAAGHNAGSSGREKAERIAMRESQEKEHEMMRANVLWTMLPPDMKQQAAGERPDLFPGQP
jgi:hypothetical protein